MRGPLPLGVLSRGKGEQVCGSAVVMRERMRSVASALTS